MAVNVQRRPANPVRDSLNEPAYGAEASYPVVYANMPTRIEFPGAQLQFTEAGERSVYPQSVVTGTDMYVDPDYTILVEDRITITQSDDASLIGQLFIVMSVTPDWNGVGDLHHTVATLQAH